MKLLHLGSPGHQLRSLEHAGLVERADLDEHSTRRKLRARGEVDSANLAEVPGGGARTVLLIERSGGAFGELETLGINRHEQIAGTS